MGNPGSAGADDGGECHGQASKLIYRARENTATTSESATRLRNSLGLQVYKYDLLWVLKSVNSTYFGLFGAPGIMPKQGMPEEIPGLGVEMMREAVLRPNKYNMLL